MNIDKEKINKFEELRKDKFISLIIEFIKDKLNDTITFEKSINFMNNVIKSDESIIKFINFSYCFERSSKSFKIISEAHRWFLNHDKNYNDFFKRAHEDEELRKFILEKQNNYDILDISDMLILGENTTCPNCDKDTLYYMDSSKDSGCIICNHCKVDTSFHKKFIDKYGRVINL